MSEPRSSFLLENGVEEDIEDALITGNTLKKPATASTSDVADPAFFFRICLDILIFLIVMDGVRRYCGTSHETAQPEPQVHTGVSRTPMTQNPRRTGSQVAKDVAAASASLNEAIRVGDVALCAAILEDADPFLTRRILGERDLWGCNVLHLAAASGSAEIVSMLVERGGSGVRVNAVDAWDQTPLHFAARAGSVEVCKILIDRGAVLDALDAQEYTALHVAAKLQHEATCEFLLDQGAGVRSTDADIPPMLSALLVKRIFEQHPATTAGY
jgi:ankyrin repeat protein